VREFLPERWVETTLGQVHLDFSQSVNPTKAADEVFELYSVPSFPRREPEVITGRQIGSSKQSVIADTVLLCGINPRLNRVWVVEPRTANRLIASTEWIPFFPQVGIVPNYLAYFLQQHEVRDFLARQAYGVGGSLMRVKALTLSEFPFPLAPKQEQDRIVAEIEKQLTRVDAAVAALKRVQANLKRYRASVLKGACEGRLVPTEAELARKEGRSYETGEQLLARILKERRAKWEVDQLAKMHASGKPPKNDDWKKKYGEPGPHDTNSLQGLPEGWGWVRAEQVCDFITKGTTPSSDKLFEGSGEVPYIKVYNLTNRGALDFTVNPTFVAKTTHAGELARSRVLPGDVLMNIVCPPLGKVSIVPELFPEWNINQAIAIFRPLHGLDRRYLATVLLCEDILRWAITRAKATAGQFNLTLEICRDLPLPLPPGSEQARVVQESEARLSAAEAIHHAVEVDLRRAERLRQSILKRAFEGTLVSQDPNDEPASVLLDRICADRAARGGDNNGGRSRKTVRNPVAVETK